MPDTWRPWTLDTRLGPGLRKMTWEELGSCLFVVLVLGIPALVGGLLLLLVVIGLLIGVPFPL
jgi:hypothetical protein